MIHSYDVASIQALEKPIIDAPNYDGWLMQRAAHALASAAFQALRQQGKAQANILLLVGSGNNGADTLYAGAELAAAGHNVLALTVLGTSEQNAFQNFISRGGRVLEEGSFSSALPVTDLMIDGILGIGARGELRGAVLSYVEAINAARAAGTLKARVIACDVPTGLSPDNLLATAPVLQADQTETFIALKDSQLGLGEHYCGELHLHSLGLDHEVARLTPSISRWSTEELAAQLKSPNPTDHKYSRGVCGIVAGSASYPGAALLTTRATINCGVGMVRFQGSESLNFQVTNHTPEVVCTSESSDTLTVNAWALGPGIADEDREKDIQAALHNPHIAAVLDAGAIETAARWTLTEKLGSHRILTPHTGEFLKLMTWLAALHPEACTDFPEPSKDSINADPLSWLRLAAKITGATVLLKGGSTLISSPNGQIFSQKGETAWLATAGSGDTLTGILGALLAQHEATQKTRDTAEPVSYARLAALAVFLHNRAALAVHAGRKGPVPPHLLAEQLPAVIAQMSA